MFLAKFFKRKKKSKEVSVSKFIYNLETRLDELELTDKKISRLEEKIKNLANSLKNFQEKLQEFTQERREMDEISKHVLELISLIYTMDHKVNDLNRKFEQAKRIAEIKEPTDSKRDKEGPKKKENKQVEFRL